MTIRLAVLSAALFLIPSTSAGAQVKVFSTAGEMIVFGDGEAPLPSALEGVPAPQGAQAPQAPGPRLEKLKKLEFDRRPSAMLAAWAKPPAPKVEDKAADKPGDKPAEKPADKPAADAPAIVPSNAPTTPPDAASVQASATDAPAPVDDAAQKAAQEQAAQKAKAEADAKKKADEAAKKAAEAKALEEELALFQRNVTLGEWSAVKAYLATLGDEEKKAGYTRLLTSLRVGPSQRPNNVQQQGQPYVEKNRFSAQDVVDLALAAPIPLAMEQVEPLGQILRQALDQGHQVEGFLELVRALVDVEGTALDRRRVAQMLAVANEALTIGEFLPSAADAEAKLDREALNLLSRHFLAQHQKDQKVAWLEQAWRTTQSALAAGEITEEVKTEAIQRAVDIAPKIKRELGAAWLNESFTSRPERGMEILAAIGSSASTALQSMPLDEDRRFKLLELQTTAAKALLDAAPERATSWRRELGVLASNWLREALVTYQFDESTSLGPRMQRDRYGNIFWYDSGGGWRGNSPKAITTERILENRPSDAWLALLDPTVLPKFQMIVAQLLLKVSEETLAFPYIEGLAKTHKRPAKDLVDEFLRVWAKNHDPNSERSRTNSYMFMYGFEQRANGIPLTRSKQERNLRELGEWIARLQKLEVELDPDLLAAAFTSAHSQAEVYRLETMEQIFGGIETMKPEMLAGLFEKMRVNLATVWRDPALQKDKKTNRRQQDIQAEVVRGYQLGRATLDKALTRHPMSWELWLARAAYEHDENEFRAETAKDPEFTARREAAFATFQKAAALYAEAVSTLDVEKETSRVFDTWFYAALGASDLQAVDPSKVLAAKQIPLIKAALRALPGERSERHMGLFANALSTRISNANPGVKFRYVREGLAIAGEHKMAREAQHLFDYYSDLVTEIALRTRIDGSDRVGHGAPFGLCVDIRHTKEIERESGGFGKYLQNQNQGNFAYNYGRPLEDYRDKFEEAARAALAENFDVLSVTFNDPQAHSKADPEYGWRVTPYAYLLIKTKGAQIDRVPPIRLDLDFLDTSGYAVVPVESRALPIDAKDDAGDERPFSNLTLTQTLDERQAKDNRLLLDVKATAIGLVPALANVLDFAFDGFDVAKSDDHGVSVVKFDDEGTGMATERTWTLTLRAKDGLAKLPDTFTFGSPRVAEAKTEQFRYVDADLKAVERSIPLEHAYGKTRANPLIWMGPLAVAGIVLGWLGWRRFAKPSVAPAARFHVPEPVTAFTVIGLLRDIESRNGLAPAEKRELDTEIEAIERRYFGDEATSAPDLRGVAERWVARVG